VNLIGEHTDYNDGFVMPVAIDRFAWVAAARRSRRTLHVFSEHFQDAAELSLDALAAPPRKHWSDYVRGVAAVLMVCGYEVTGADLLIHSEVPVGAGVSSSAALEVATAMALTSISDIQVPPLELVKICQRAEHEYVGTRCGIMDQFAAMFAQAGHALVLDCRSLDYQQVTINHNVKIVLVNSMVSRELAAGEYNRRRAECESGVTQLRKALPNVHALRDVSLDALEQHKSDLPDQVYRRCRHVITENQRVLAAAAALKAQDLAMFGRLMRASHSSLRDDYEVSCRELDLLCELASECDGVYGARMTGGGFGGCTVNLVRADAVVQFQSKIVDRYRNATGKSPAVYVCSAAGGAHTTAPEET
jgi:galactokinase